MKQLSKILCLTIYLSALSAMIAACSVDNSGSTPNNTSVGDDGTLSVANAPVDIGGSFVADVKGTSAYVVTDLLTIGWFEYGLSGHLEGVTLDYELATGKSHVRLVNNGLPPETWYCSDSDAGNALCPGITIDKTAGTITFADQVLVSESSSSASPITLNGTLHFTPP